MSAAPTVDEDPGPTPHWDLAPALPPCVRVMSGPASGSPRPRPAADWTGSPGLCPVWCSVRRGSRWASPHMAPGQVSRRSTSAVLNCGAAPALPLTHRKSLKRREKSLKENLKETVSEGSSLIFIALLVEPDGSSSSRLPSYWLDPCASHHPPQESSALRWVSLASRPTLFDAVIFSSLMEKCCAALIKLSPVHCPLQHCHIFLFKWWLTVTSGRATWTNK